jgi:hypothetical protein
MMIPRNRTISRRSVLRGAGVALGLPWLEAMIPSFALASTSKQANLPVRLAVMYMPNGVNTSTWTPEGQGRDWKLSPTLEPLQDLKDQVLVVSNLWNAGANTGDGHYVKESSILTCTTISKTLGVDINMHGISMDQLAAQRIAEQTPLPSLELGIEPESTGVDTNVGYTRVYGSHIAWSSPTTPLAREINPRSVMSGSSGLQIRTATRRNRTPSYWIVCSGRQRSCGLKSARPIASASTNISGSCVPWKRGWNERATPSGIPGSPARHSTPWFGPPMLLAVTPSTYG